MGVRIPPSGPINLGNDMQRICKHCKKHFELPVKSNWMANHTRWCDKNPKLNSYKKSNPKAVFAMNEKKKLTGVTNQFVKAKLEGKPIPVSHMKGTVGNFKGKKHSEKTKKIISEKALASTHRRLQKNIIEYNGIKLDSSWELALAKRLDEQHIKWVRPNPLPWFDKNGVKHNYFADFYLPDYDVYLDPKNPGALKVQKEKIECLLTQYKNIRIIKTLDECKLFEI